MLCLLCILTGRSQISWFFDHNLHRLADGFLCQALDAIWSVRTCAAFIQDKHPTTVGEMTEMEDKNHMNRNDKISTY